MAVAMTVSVLGMQTQVYGNVECDHCSTHQYDNTVTYNKHTAGPGGAIYTEQRVVTTGSGGGGVPASSTITTTYGGGSSANNQVIYEGSGNRTNFAPNQHIFYFPSYQPLAHLHNRIKIVSAHPRFHADNIRKKILILHFNFCIIIILAQGCSRNPCGTGARCQETVGGRPVCSCPPGYQGNPLTYCHRSGCLDHNECGQTQVCRNGECVNPCIGTCGVNAQCEVRNHVPTCSCPRGYRGDPFSSCRQMDPGMQFNRTLKIALNLALQKIIF